MPTKSRVVFDFVIKVIVAVFATKLLAGIIPCLKHIEVTNYMALKPVVCVFIVLTACVSLVNNTNKSNLQFASLCLRLAPCSLNDTSFKQRLSSFPVQLCPEAGEFSIKSKITKF